MELGRRERRHEGDGVFSRRTGAGHVKAKAGDYERALENGVEVVPLLVETFGGFGSGLVAMLKTAAEWRHDRLDASEYDETTWAARKYTPFVTQKLSVAVHLSMAQRSPRRWGCRWRRTRVTERAARIADACPPSGRFLSS